MGSEELSLSWDDHHNTLVGVFEELLDSSTLVDCTIAAEGQYLKAHKVVLSACSPYFQMLFSQENEKNPIVILKDIKFTELKSLIDFVYRGKVKLQRDQLENFVAAAESLQIKGLASQDRKKGDKSATKSASKMAGCSSPIPHKRRRSRPSSPSEDDVKVTNADTGRGSDNNVLEHSVVPEMPVDVHQSSSAGTFLTSLKDSNSHPHSSRTNHERRVVETKSRQRQSSSPEVLLPDADPVIKTEPDADPEPITEIFVEEPKDEEYLDDMNLLESEDGNADTATGSMGVEQSTNQYSIFTPVFDATDDSYLVSQMQEQSGAQGGQAVPSPTAQGGLLRELLTSPVILGPVDPPPLLPHPPTPPMRVALPITNRTPPPCRTLSLQTCALCTSPLLCRALGHLPPP